MKIFFPIARYYPSQVGGPCNTVYWHAKTLTEKNIQTTVVSTTVGIEGDLVKSNTKYKDLSGEVYYGSGDTNNIKTIYNVLKEITKSDIIHLNSLFSTFSIISFVFARLLFPSKPLVISIRGELSKEALEFSSVKKRPILVLYKILSRNVTFHSTSTQESSLIQSTFPNRNFVQIPNFILPADRLNLQIDKQLLFVGRIHPIKAIDKLIRAVSKSRIFMNTDFKLIIVGKVEDRNGFYLLELKKLIQSLKLTGKIIFKGHLDGLTKEKLYSSSYGLILPSESENFGNVVVESLNQGTPVLASLGTPWNILEKYNCGFHVSNAPSKLSAKIDHFLQLSPNDYYEMRDNAIKLVDAKYNIKSNIDTWIEIYQKLSKQI